MKKRSDQSRPETSLSKAGKILLAIGGPAVAWPALSQWVVRHRALAVSLVVVYEILVFFLGEIWKRLKDRWMDAIAHRVDQGLREIISPYRRKYLRHLFYECRDFDVKGLTTQGTFTLELQRVFVELSVDAQPPHETSPSLIPKLPQYLLEGRHTIWEYLKTNGNLALIGAPGSGKTTLLRHIALILTGRGKYTDANVPKKLPVFLFLRNHAKDVGGKKALKLPQVIEASISKDAGPTPPDGWFMRRLKKGGCLILLDGLDEVPDQDVRQRLVEWLEKQMRAYGKNSFVVTSRPYGYRSNPLAGVHTLTVRPFSPQQINTFVFNWYLSNELISHNKDDSGVRKEAIKGASDLMRRIRSSEVLTALAVNPLLLTMIATVHRYRSELPGRRVELYHEICEVFLGKRQDVRGVERRMDLTPSQKQAVLEPLAYQMMLGRTREISAEKAASIVEYILRRISPATIAVDFFKMIENTSGMLIERESGEYEFAHKTFQEYLTSVHCKNQHLEFYLAERVYDDWWNETIRLYVAQADATPILEVCLRDDPPSAQGIACAIQCLEEAQQVDHQWREKLNRVLTADTEDEDRERLYAEGLLALRQRQMISLGDEQWVDSSLVSNAEYQLFLNDMRTRNRCHQPDHWKSHHFNRGEGTKPIIGVRPTDAAAFCHWLTNREDSWIYRLPVHEELIFATSKLDEAKMLEEIGCWESNPHLLGGISTDNRMALVEEVRRFITSELLPKDLYSGRSRAHKIAVELERSLTLDFDGAIDADANGTFARVHALATSPNHKFAHVHGFDWNLFQNLSQMLGIARHRALDFMGERVVTSEFTYAVDSAVVREVMSVLERRIWGSSGQTRVRVDSLLMAGIWMQLHASKSISAKTSNHGLRKLLGTRINSSLLRAIEERVEAWLDLYVQLGIIEGRIQGRIPLFGGIMLVRERQEMSGHFDFGENQAKAAVVSV